MVQPELTKVESAQMSTSSTGAGTPSTVPKTSFTTASGDGLTFDPVSLLSVFDEVSLIVRGLDREEQPEEPTVRKDEAEVPDFLMEDVPRELDPLSLLLESAEQIEKLKSELVPLQERDLELREFMRTMSRKDLPGRIDTCSFTLEALVTQLKQSLENESTLREREA